MDRSTKKLDITPNRPDALSHQGVARDIAAKTERNFNHHQINPIKSRNRKTLSIKIENKKDCPRYIGGIVRNLKVGPSPEWMVNRLKAVGQRSINNIVDISNYVLLEMGQPTHIFDYDKFDGDEILIRRAKNGEKLISLDEKQHILNETQLIITDGHSPIGLAGIMGGLSSSISENTTTVLVESAYFNPVTIRKSAKNLQMNTDASKRFERGADPDGVEKGFLRIINLLEELAEGELISQIVDEYPLIIKQPNIILRRTELDLVLGYHVEKTFVDQILKSLEIIFQNNREGEWNCTPPSFRPDIEREIDIIEEVARMVGYDKLPSEQNISGSFRHSEPDSEKQIQTVKSILVGMGFFQIYSNSLQNEIDSGINRLNAVKIFNPLSKEMSFLRTSLLPGLLRAADFNVKNGNHNFRIFELANIHQQLSSGFDGIKENKSLACIIHGLSKDISVHHDSMDEDFFSIKGYLNCLLSEKYFIEFELVLNKHPLFEFSQCIIIDKNEVGVIGRISPIIINKLGLDLKIAYGFEIHYDNLIPLINKKREFAPINLFPKIIRDINLVMPESQPVEQIIKKILTKGNSLILEASPMNIFKDRNSIGSGKKSVTISITFQHHSKTLEDKDVNPIIDEIISIVNKDFNAKLRS